MDNNKKIPTSSIHNAELYEWLSAENCFYEFKNRVSEVMKTVGINDWTYSSLDLPDQISIEQHIGTYDKEHFKRYMGEGFYEWEMMIECTRRSLKPLFRSQLEDQLNKLTLRNEKIENYLKSLMQQKKLGYDDTYCIPLNSVYGHNFLFCATSKGLDPVNFRSKVNTNKDRINFIGKVVDNVGVTKFPSYFVEPQKHHEKIVSSFPVKLMAAIDKLDLTNEDAAKYFDTSLQNIERALGNFQQMMGMKTILGAYNKAKDKGYI